MRISFDVETQTFSLKRDSIVIMQVSLLHRSCGVPRRVPCWSSGPRQVLGHSTLSQRGRFGLHGLKSTRQYSLNNDDSSGSEEDTFALVRVVHSTLLSKPLETPAFAKVLGRVRVERV